MLASKDEFMVWVRRLRRPYEANSGTQVLFRDPPNIGQKRALSIISRGVPEAVATNP
jgi:hypothetical protein